MTTQLVALRRVGLASTIFAFALVVWGAIVRINGAGMTCPDWPRCRGAWLPALNDPVVYEWTHRLAAMLLTAAIVATFVAAWRARFEVPEGLRAAYVSLALIAAQVVAGWLTIKYNNNPLSVALHLVVGFATFVSLLVVTLIAYGRAAKADRSRPGSIVTSSLAIISIMLAFAAVFAAGFMSASNDGLACTGFPLCSGLGIAQSPGQQIHMAHRFVAYATIVAVLVTWIAVMRRQRHDRSLVATASTALGLAIVQGALGALTVVSQLNPIMRSLHEANGALLVGSLAALTYFELRYAPALAQTVRNYVGLTKPGVMSLLLFTTITSMMIAAGGFPSWSLTVWTLLGGALASASSAAINMYYDRDIDAKMRRTSKRPIPSGRVAPRNALIFGIALGLGAFALLALTVNLLAATLSSLGILYYVFVYTKWLKRSTPQNIVIGGAAGSVPPLVGWAAVTNHIGLTAVLLFLIVFVWTPPHFWALALLKKEEYARVGVPMMPAVYGDAETKRQMLLYAIALSALTIAMVPLHLMGVIYLASAILLDAIFLGFALWVARAGTPRSEGLMYRFSMLYLALLFAAMVADRFGHTAS